MPRLRSRNAEATETTRKWVTALVRSEMTHKGVGYRELAQKLTELGLDESERNLRNRTARGELSASIFLACMYVLKADPIDVPNLPRKVTPQWEISTVLNDPLVTVLNRDDRAGLYQVQIGSLVTPITIFLQQSGETTTYSTSHYIETPDFNLGHLSKTGTAASPAEALRLAIQRLVGPYRAASAIGRDAKEICLVISHRDEATTS